MLVFFLEVKSHISGCVDFTVQVYKQSDHNKKQRMVVFHSLGNFALQMCNQSVHNRKQRMVVFQYFWYAGLFTGKDVQNMLDEIIKMDALGEHRNVMPLLGVCTDAGPGIALVMPYMVQGSLLDYLKRERSNLVIPETLSSDAVRNLPTTYLISTESWCCISFWS